MQYADLENSIQDAQSRSQAAAEEARMPADMAEEKYSLAANLRKQATDATHKAISMQREAIEAAKRAMSIQKER